jgi:hypothetical protein
MHSLNGVWTYSMFLTAILIEEFSVSPVEFLTSHQWYIMTAFLVHVESV